MNKDRLLNVVVKTTTAMVIVLSYATPAEAYSYIEETKDLYKDKQVIVEKVKVGRYISEKNPAY